MNPSVVKLETNKIIKAKDSLSSSFQPSKTKLDTINRPHLLRLYARTTKNVIKLSTRYATLTAKSQNHIHSKKRDLSTTVLTCPQISRVHTEMSISYNIKCI